MEIPHDKVWFTSDLHFYHKNICKYCNRPYESVEEMNEGIIQNWNSVVKDDDIVFVLGDLGFCGSEKLMPLIERLKGKKYVVQGNHDSDKIIAKLYEADLIEDYYKLRKPLTEQQRKDLQDSNAQILETLKSYESVYKKTYDILAGLEE